MKKQTVQLLTLMILGIFGSSMVSAGVSYAGQTVESDSVETDSGSASATVDLKVTYGKKLILAVTGDDGTISSKKEFDTIRAKATELPSRTSIALSNQEHGTHAGYSDKSLFIGSGVWTNTDGATVALASDSLTFKHATDTNSTFIADKCLFTYYTASGVQDLACDESATLSLGESSRGANYFGNEFFIRLDSIDVADREGEYTAQQTITATLP